MSNRRPPLLEMRRLLALPIARQSPIAALIAFAAVLSVSVDTLDVTSHAAFLASLVITGVATAIAALASPLGGVPGIGYLAPAIDFIAIGLLRFSTGGSASIFTSLIALPLVWMASQRRARLVVAALVGVAVTLLLPLVLEPPSDVPVTELLRLLFVLCCYGTVATVVHLLARGAWQLVRTAQRGEERVVREIDRAAAVQRSLLPQALTAVPGLSISGTCLPAASVGGDFFDWYSTDKGIAITLGDVMGKGVGASLIAAAVRAVIRSAGADADPGDALRRAADGLAVDATERTDGIAFTTVFHARLERGVLRWADAGHGLTVLVRADGTGERLATSDLPLGLGIDDNWETTTTPMEPGDMVVCFSDGVLDLFGGDLTTVDRIIELAQVAPDPAELVSQIAAIAADVPHDDDVTIVALRREPVAVRNVLPQTTERRAMA